MYFSNSVNYTASKLYLSNITDEEIECSIRFYNDEGIDISARADVYKGSSTTGALVLEHSQTDTFTIPPRGSRVAQYYDATATRYEFGYAIVQWSSTNPAIGKAMLGNHRTLGRGGNGTISYTTDLINNGQPF